MARWRKNLAGTRSFWKSDCGKLRFEIFHEKGLWVLLVNEGHFDRFSFNTEKGCFDMAEKIYDEWVSKGRL